MSFLQKLESLYSGLIRLLTVVLTLALLIVAGVSLVKWQRATEDPRANTPTMQSAVPNVATEDVVMRVVASRIGTAANPISANDPNKAAYDRIRKTVGAFANKHEVPKEDADLDDLMNSVRTKAGYYYGDSLRAAYVSGLADALDHALANPQIEALLAKKPTKSSDEWSYADEVTPVGLARDVIDQYDTEFTRQSEYNDRDAYGEVNLKERQSAAWRSLARTAGPLLLLILVLQLLTYGRIEQNTRQLGKNSK
ncbi:MULTISPECIES: hypothetical protein [Cupriavidus]